MEEVEGGEREKREERGRDEWEEGFMSSQY